MRLWAGDRDFWSNGRFVDVDCQPNLSFECWAFYVSKKVYRGLEERPQIRVAGPFHQFPHSASGVYLTERAGCGRRQVQFGVQWKRE